MKLANYEKELMTNHIVEQLNQLDFYETDGKSQRELINILARMRAMEIEVSGPEKGWF